MTQLKDLVRDDTDRRRDVRYACLLEGAIGNGDVSSPCEIVSLSSGGLSARWEGKLEKGDVVEVSGPPRPSGLGDRPLSFQVQWSSQGGAVQLVRLSAQDAPEVLPGSWLAEELEELRIRAREVRQRRGGVRVTCEIPATLSWDGVERAATIHDLGTTGARIESAGEPLPEGILVLAFQPLTDKPEIVVEVSVTSVHDTQTAEYGVAFRSFRSGSPQELLGAMNHLFASQRASNSTRPAL